MYPRRIIKTYDLNSKKSFSVNFYTNRIKKTNLAKEFTYAATCSATKSMSTKSSSSSELDSSSSAKVSRIPDENKKHFLNDGDFTPSCVYYIEHIQVTK